MTMAAVSSLPKSEPCGEHVNGVRVALSSNNCGTHDRVFYQTKNLPDRPTVVAETTPGRHRYGEHQLLLRLAACCEITETPEFVGEQSQSFDHHE